MIESVGDAGIIVEQGDAGALASAMRTCLHDEKTYQALRREAEERASKFGYERYRERIGEIFGAPNRRGV
jgi:glycosyltransferase involved in cell wall biosynthesis